MFVISNSTTQHSYLTVPIFLQLATVPSTNICLLFHDTYVLTTHDCTFLQEDTQPACVSTERHRGRIVHLLDDWGAGAAAGTWDTISGKVHVRLIQCSAMGTAQFCLYMSSALKKYEIEGLLASYSCSFSHQISVFIIYSW